MFDTTLGKSVKVLIYLAISGAIAALLDFFTKNPVYFTPWVVALINIVLVAGRNFFSKDVKNF